MIKTFGVFAHVDAGKTTFSEQIIYHGKAIQSCGRVDHKNTFFDTDILEKERGITIFSSQAHFFYQGDEYFFIDTPGHIDFSAEMERALTILDYAVLLISGADGIQGHTETLWHLLRQSHIPTFLFLNKMDILAVQKEDRKRELLNQLSQDILFFEDGLTEWMKEELVQRDENLFDLYLEKPDRIDWKDSLTQMIQQEKIFPCLFGSALKGQGVEEFLRFFHTFTKTDYHNREKDRLKALVYKIKYRENKERLTFIKILSGSIRRKEEIMFDCPKEEKKEKVNQLSILHGSKYRETPFAFAGQLAAVSGFSTPKPGDWIGEGFEKTSYQMVPAMMARVEFDSSISASALLEALRILEAEDPMLLVNWDAALRQIDVHVMGQIQLEILKDVIKNRFGYYVEFGIPEVLYYETIEEPVMGYGHFEPLRHYAEVALLLEPAPRGSKIHCFSRCHVDILARNYQNLILSHIMERKHKGILTGSAVTDLNITLITGRAHKKHTEGGDFREAVYRAIRQGLEKAKNRLLEPYYFFRISAETEYIGRVISDLTRLSASFDPPMQKDGKSIIQGKGPVSSFLTYRQTLLSFTKGKGQISFGFAGYDVCHNEKEVMEKKNYKKDSDLENTSSSVFCAKGSSFVVNWKEAENYMHTLKSQ